MNPSIQSKPVGIIAGIVMAILGVYLFANPHEANIAFTVAAGWLSIISGVASLVMVIASAKKLGGIAGVSVASAALQLIFGIALVMFPAFWVIYLFVMIAIFTIIASLTDIAAIANARKSGAPSSALAITSAIITLILGIVILIAPIATAGIATEILGCLLIIAGIAKIITVAAA